MSLLQPIIDLCGSPEMITLVREAESSIEPRLAWLDALEAAGVDNWEGCSHAADMMTEEYGPGWAEII